MTATPVSRPFIVWLRELSALRPAPWEWTRALRAAISVGLPFTLGLAFNDSMTGMWIAMGTLMMTTGELPGSYGQVLRRLSLAACMGASGYLLGYLTDLSWLTTVIVMGLVGLTAGLLSSVNATLSIGCLQLLLTAAIAIGVPTIAPFWQPAALYLVGAAFYAALILIEAALVGDRPRRIMLSNYLAALAALAQARADGKTADAARRDVTMTHAALLSALPRSSTKGSMMRYRAACQLGDTLFIAILAAKDGHELRQVAPHLNQLAEYVTRRRSTGAHSAWINIVDTTADFHELADQVQALAAALRAETWPAGRPPAPTASGHARVPPAVAPRDRTALQAGLALGVCLAAAYATRWVNPENHWFWVPLTVGLVMKPDLGSIFARAVLRTIGTLVGVILGTIILALIPKSQLFALVITVLAGVLPWAMKRSYAVQAIVLTPLVLMLVDIIMPGVTNVDYGGQRLVDTLIGGGIVLLFGYLIWPRNTLTHLATADHAVRQQLADYLREVATPAATPASTANTRLQTYAALARMRNYSQRHKADPPPSGTQAAQALARIDTLERVADAITRHVRLSQVSSVPIDHRAVEQLAQAIATDIDTSALLSGALSDVSLNDSTNVRANPTDSFDVRPSLDQSMLVDIMRVLEKLPSLPVQHMA